MSCVLHIEGHAPAACRSFRHHVHTDVTRTRSQADPRIPGRSRHEPFTITRTLDGLTPHLLAWCAQGAVVPELSLVVERPGAQDEAPAPWFRFVLSSVLVTSVLTSLEDTGPIETITLDYGAVRWSFEGEGRASTCGWDVLTNTPT